MCVYGIINEKYFPKYFKVPLRATGIPIPDSCCLHSCFFRKKFENSTKNKQSGCWYEPKMEFFMSSCQHLYCDIEQIERISSQINSMLQSCEREKAPIYIPLHYIPLLSFFQCTIASSSPITEVHCQIIFASYEQGPDIGEK